MLDWLQDAFPKDAEVQPLVLTFRLTMGLLLGGVVAGVYRFTNGKARTQAVGLTATLVLLTVLICMVTQVIGNSVARAFSLVGALAIVRFRTVVEDTRDTAFVIFAVTVGMAVGSGAFEIALMGIPFAAVAAYLFRTRDTALEPQASVLEYILTVRVGVGRAPEALLGGPFGRHLESAHLIAVSTVRQGAVLELGYRVRLRSQDAAAAFVTELNGVEGVQEVALRQSQP